MEGSGRWKGDGGRGRGGWCFAVVKVAFREVVCRADGLHPGEGAGRCSHPAGAAPGPRQRRGGPDRPVRGAQPQGPEHAGGGACPARQGTWTLLLLLFVFVCVCVYCIVYLMTYLIECQCTVPDMIMALECVGKFLVFPFQYRNVE